jgi:hypothetical protein
MFPEKIVLTEKQEAWLIRHFRNTKNAECAQRLGISESSLHRHARRLGLTKTRQFVKKCQRDAASKAKGSHLLNGTYPPKGFAIPNRDAGAFRQGDSYRQRYGKRADRKRLAKSVATRNETIRKERMRIKWGLEQKTKLHLTQQHRRHIQLRCYLLSRGYALDEDNGIAYYDDRTKRGRIVEGRLDPYYKLQELTELNGVL